MPVSLVFDGSINVNTRRQTMSSSELKQYKVKEVNGKLYLKNGMWVKA